MTAVEDPPSPTGPAVASLARVGGFDDNDTPYLNRELSWLAFNARVLELARDDASPLIERVKFLAIFSSNLDEFFQVRVAGLRDQLAAEVGATSPDNRTPGEQLDAIARVVRELCREQEHIFVGDIAPKLARSGIAIVGYGELGADEVAAVADEFAERIFPVLTPLAVDPGHPFPYISDLSLNLAVVLRDPVDDRRVFARVKVPNILPRFIAVSDDRFIALESVIAAHIGALFPGMEVLSQDTFRVTRNADLTLEEEEAEDLLQAVEMELRRRRFGRSIRLEVQTSMSDEVLALLLRELDLDDDDVFVTSAPLDLTGLFVLADKGGPELRNPSWSGVVEPELLDEDGSIDVFASTEHGNVLVHHPYSSFSDSVVEFVRQAAKDSDVLAIKMTLYRTSGDSPIIDALVNAAERGKQVAVLVELKARFDEAANIGWARRLEKAGVHVAYGLVGLKIHTKVCMVVREEDDGIVRYCHVGTGNYNPRTARIYEDLGLLTRDPVVGNDVANLFNFLTGYGRDIEFDRLLVAPAHLRPALERYIENETTAERGRIVMKMNSLTDASMIDRLYEASQAGVRIDLVVRGICCLRPGVPGLSENIRVRSIVGRYLEHSRIFYFANADGPERPAYFIGSADLMNRNLNRRVEATVRIVTPALQRRLKEVLETNLADSHLAWDLGPDGQWTRRRVEGGVDTHVRLQELARERADR